MRVNRSGPPGLLIAAVLFALATVHVVPLRAAVTCVVEAAYVNNDGGSTVTSGSFDVAANDLIIVALHYDDDDDANDFVHTITDNQGPDLTYTLIAERQDVEAGATFTGLAAAYYHKVVSPITGLTITLTEVDGTDGDSPAIKVYSCTGYDTADPIGAVGEGNSTANNFTTSAVTSETAGTFFVVGTDWAENGAPTSSDLAVTGFNTTGDISGGSGFKAIGSAGASVTGNLDSPGATASNWVAVWFEIRDAGGGGGGATSRGLLTLGVGGV